MSNFRVGQKVVCISTDLHDICQKGGVYTVSAVKLAPDWCGITRPGILLAEIDLHKAVRALGRKPRPNVCFDAQYFRPVVEPKTDISVFEKLLDKINQGDRKLVREAAE